MPYRLIYHPAVHDEDLPTINPKLLGSIRRAIERRLVNEPSYYGEPLRYRLKGYWKLRVGDYRIIYRIISQDVWILAIGHRKEVYSVPQQRLGWEP